MTNKKTFFSFLSIIFLSRLTIWKRLLAGVVVGIVSTWALVRVDGAIVAALPSKDLQIDEQVKAALQSGVDTGKTTYEIQKAKLAVKDVPAPGVTMCTGGAQEECVFTFGEPLNHEFFKKHTDSARAIALHEIGHAVAYKRGIQSEWLVYIALFAMLAIAATGLSSHVAGMLGIGVGFTALHAVMLKFPYKDLTITQLSVMLLLAITVCGLVPAALSRQWFGYPKFVGFAANPYAAAAAALSFVLIAHLNNNLEAYSDLVAACDFQSVEPLRNGLRGLAIIDGSRYSPTISWLFDPFHPDYQSRVDALTRIEAHESLMRQCSRIKDKSSVWIAGSY